MSRNTPGADALPNKPTAINELDLSMARTREAASLLIGQVLRCELPGALCAITEEPYVHHSLIMRIVAKVMKEGSPEWKIEDDGIGEPERLSNRGLHTDGNKIFRRALRVHTQVSRGVTDVAFAFPSEEYPAILGDQGHASDEACALAEELFLEDRVNTALMSSDVYVGSQEQGITAVFGIHGSRDSWHRFSALGERSVLISQVNYVLPPPSIGSILSQIK